MIDPLRPFDTQVEKKDEKQQIQRVEVRGWMIVEVKVEGSNNCYWGFKNSNRNDKQLHKKDSIYNWV